MGRKKRSVVNIIKKISWEKVVLHLRYFCSTNRNGDLGVTILLGGEFSSGRDLCTIYLFVKSFQKGFDIFNDEYLKFQILD